jgi:lysophospholipase L1-like esterase
VDRGGDRALWGRRSVLMGVAASMGLVVANPAQPPASAGDRTLTAPESPYVLRWTPDTHYQLGQQVISPLNDVVSAKLAHTSSATYAADLARWALTSTFSQPPPDNIDIHPGYGRLWLEALAHKSKPVVAVIGDSISKKFNASSVAASWVGLLRDELQTSYGDGGSGFVGMADADSNFLSVYYEQYPPGDVVQLTGAWFGGNGFRIGPGFTQGCSTTLGSTATFHVRGSRVDTFALGVSTAGGSYSVNIDGDAAGSVATGSRAHGVPFRVNAATGLSAGWHTVLVTLLAGDLNFFGVCAENPSGLVLNNFSSGGATTRPDTAGVVRTQTPAWNGGTSYPADLVIYALGVNDLIHGLYGTLAHDTSQRVRAHLAGIRQGTSSSQSHTDIVLLGNHIGSRDDTPLAYHHLQARYRELAQTYQGAFVDMWGAYANNWDTAKAAGYWGSDTMGVAGSDTLHPGDTGHRAIYQTVRKIVVP